MKSLLQYILLMMSLVLASSGVGQAQGSEKYKNFPVPFGLNNVGKEFYLSFPANWETGLAGGQKYVRLYITSGTRTRVNVWVGEQFKKAIFTIPYDIVTVDLDNAEAQVFVRDDASPIPDDQVYKKKAVHIESEAPIVVYGINRLRYSSDGLLALPVNALGQDYVAASYGAVTDGTAQNLPSQYMITAPYDGTLVTITSANASPNNAEGKTFAISMDKGDVFSSMAVGYGGDVSGTLISATKPIAVTSGQNCTYIPNEAQYCCCNHMCEMLFPITTWGKFYQSVPYVRRRKGDIYRIYAGEDQAKVFINGTLYGTIPQKGGQNGTGFLEYRPLVPDLYEFSSDKPIMVAQYNTSQQYDGVNTDPFFIMLTPLEQYQTDLVFATPSGDFVENYVNIVSDSAGYYAIEIAAGGTGKFQKLSTAYGSALKTFITRVNGKEYVGTTFQIQAGTYRLRGTSPFAGYMYGFSSYDSYGYPLSAALGNLTIKDSIAPLITKTQLCDGTVDASVTDYPEDDATRSNLAFLWLDADTANTYNYNLFVEPTFETGFRTTTYQLRVIDPKQDAQAVVVISDRAGNFTIDTIHYDAFNVSIAPDPAIFGNLIVGAVKQQTLTITNNSPRPVVIRSTQLQDGTRGFKILTQIPVAGITLAPAGSANSSTTIDVEFTATKGGSYSDSVGITDPCGLHYLSLVNVNVGTPVINVTDHDFGVQLVGSRTPWKMTVSNASPDGGVLIITGATGPFGAPPPIFTTPNGLPVFPLILAPSEFREIDIIFEPAAVQTYIDSIVFSSNAVPHPMNDSVGILQGAGVQASLLATSHDWGRRRVRTGPYVDSVFIRNLGSTTVNVSGIKSTTGDVGDFAILNPTAITGPINVGDSMRVDVSFNPTVIGPRQMVIEYNHDANQTAPVQSRLDGIGIEPKLATDSLDFGTMTVNDPPKPLTVRFWLEGDPLYRDTVAITSFQFLSDQFGGQADFQYDQAAVQLPVVLRPGKDPVTGAGTDTVSFTGTFQAKTIGLRTASIRAITNDGVDTTSYWIGVGQSFAADIIGIPDSVRNICVSDSALLTVTISNPGSANLVINGLRMKGSPTSFRIVNPNPNNSFTLAPLQSQPVQIQYVPSTINTVESDKLVVSNNSATPDYEVDVSGSAVKFTLTSAVDLTGSANNQVELGKEMNATVSITQDLAPLNTQNYSVTLNYDPKKLNPRTAAGAIKLEAVNPAGAIVTVDPASKSGKLIVNVFSPTALTGSGKLVTVPFGVMFTTDVQRSIDSVSVTLNDVSCATIASSADSIGVKAICGLNLRLIELTGSTYALDQNTPNPFNPVTRINYSVGLDGPTRMLLYDANGHLVQTLFNEYQQPGTYELTLDVSNLASGNYYYRLISGTWSKTKMLTVLK